MKTKGFTLIELLIVVAIIGILVLVVLPNFLTAQIKARVARSQADVNTIVNAMMMYRVDFNDIPPYERNTGTTQLIKPIHIQKLRYVTTPVSYLSAGQMVSPFGTFAGYWYYNWDFFIEKTGQPRLFYWNSFSNPEPATWMVSSLGPNRSENPWQPVGDSTLILFNDYDPSNGVTSAGIIQQHGN